MAAEFRESTWDKDSPQKGAAEEDLPVQHAPEVPQDETTASHFVHKAVLNHVNDHRTDPPFIESGI
ncbi:MAG: hypothetical protein QUV08_11200 [Parasphingorhabdus sp.]|nr:hypothetical protein [Parasphingorhabdus sp.]